MTRDKPHNQCDETISNDTPESDFVDRILTAARAFLANERGDMK